MKNIEITLTEGTFNGNILMKSSASQISAIRASRSAVKKHDDFFDGQGVYFLIMEDESIYVGIAKDALIRQRIFSPHRDNIQKTWKTVIAFKFADLKINPRELEYIENAMCEYINVKTNYVNRTSSPEKENCNAKYRKTHYNIGSIGRDNCEDYIRDIKYYIEIIPDSLFPKRNPATKVKTPPEKSPQVKTPPEKTKRKNEDKNKHNSTKPEKALFYFKSPKRDSEGRAEIQIHCGHDKKREATLLKGSKVSKEIAPQVAEYAIIKKRLEYEKSGKIKNRILQEDITFDSQSGAGVFLNGTTFDGNKNWKTVDGNTILKELL